MNIEQMSMPRLEYQLKSAWHISIDVTVAFYPAPSSRLSTVRHREKLIGRGWQNSRTKTLLSQDRRVLCCAAEAQGAKATI